MRDLDFLPDWYKDRKKSHSRMRKQYIALVAVFLMMMTFNLTALHRAGRVAADVSRCEDQRVHAEATVHEFNLIVRELNQIKARADLVRRVDTRIDVAPILAEISHIVDDSVLLSRIEFVGEPVSPPEEPVRVQVPVALPVGAANPRRESMLGESTLRVVLAGIAVQSSQVADLVYRLDRSAYFRQVRPSSYGRAKIQLRGATAIPVEMGTVKGDSPGMMDVTSFEITCVLANFEEGEKR
ncbi:MAG: hypothetical protein GX448_15475 [Planctomycetes bacterium]|nr:hypothetical protein [Planctomycetota bacterium]